MKVKRDVSEALRIFDQLTDEQKEIALDRLWDILSGACEMDGTDV